jgi:hypothetical protein
LPEMAWRVCGSGEELLDEREIVIGAEKNGGAARGRHGGEEKAAGATRAPAAWVGWISD